MSVLSDHWIKKMSLEKKMISPFVQKQQRKNKISFGLSSYGYDARVSNEFKIFTNIDSAFVDPYTLSLHDALPISEERRVGKECIFSLRTFFLSNDQIKHSCFSFFNFF